MAGTTFIYLLSNVCGGVLSLLCTYLIAKYLNDSQIGSVGIFTMWSGIISSTISLGLHSTIVVKVNQLHERYHSSVIGNIFKIYAINFVVILVLVLIYRLNFNSLYNNTWLILIALLHGFLMCLFLGLITIFQAKSIPGNYLFARLIVGTSDLIFLIFAFNNEADLVKLRILSLIFSAALGVMFCYLKLRKYLRNYSDTSTNGYKELYKIGLSLTPHVFGVLMQTILIRLIIELKLSISLVGKFFMITQVTTIYYLYIEAANKAYAPWLMKHLNNVKKNKNRIFSAKLLLYAYSALGAIGIVILYPYICHLIEKPDLKEYNHVFTLYILGFFFNALYFSECHYLYFYKKTWILSIITCFNGLIYLMCSGLLINKFGLVGTGQAFFGAQVVQFIATYITSKSIQEK